MISGSFMSADHYRLELIKTLPDDQSQGVNLRLVNEDGTAIMTFKLPDDIVRALTSSEEDCLLTMSPSGSVELYSDDDPPRQLLKIGLDELIQENLTPDMLEDEPNLKAQLTALRQKLMVSLAVVDQTLADLDKPNT